MSWEKAFNQKIVNALLELYKNILLDAPKAQIPQARKKAIPMGQKTTTWLRGEAKADIKKYNT